MRLTALHFVLILKSDFFESGITKKECADKNEQYLMCLLPLVKKQKKAVLPMSPAMMLKPGPTMRYVTVHKQPGSDPFAFLTSVSKIQH